MPIDPNIALGVRPPQPINPLADVMQKPSWWDRMPLAYREHPREYRAWRAMRNRCRNPKVKGWEYWGGRGITISDEFETFEDFYAYVGDSPAGNSLDRIDNNGNYEPGNVHWASDSQQGRNKRNNRLAFYEGKERTLAEIAEMTGLSIQVLWYRLLSKRSRWTDGVGAPKLDSSAIISKAASAKRRAA